MKKKTKRIMLIITTMSIVALVYAFYPNRSNEPENVWETQKVIRRNISTSVLATGIIKPKVGAEVRVGSRASGTVTNLYVNIGDYVKKGQLLAEIDSSELKAKYNQALANLANAKVNMKYAKIELDRMKKLNEKEYVSEQTFDNAQRAFEITKSRVMQEKANVEFAKIQLGYTKIYAPTSGVIGSVSTQEGETVSASFSSPTFVTIIDLDRLEVWTYVSLALLN